VTDDRGEHLARLIEENPEDFEAYRTYCDWLEERGDPRPQLMALQLARETVTDRNKLDHLERRLSELFEQHRAHFLGKLANVMPKPTASRQARDSAALLEWRWGFIYKVVCRQFGRLTIDKFLEHLLAHPSGRFIVELRAQWVEDAGAVVAVLAKRAPPSLRRLWIGAQEASLAALWPRLAHLHQIRFTVRGHDDIVLPELRIAQLDVRRPEGLHAIARAHVPKLERLELSFERDDTATAEDILRVLARDDLPALRALVLNCRLQLPYVLRSLAHLRIGKQLTVLELRHFDDATADALTTFDPPVELLKLGEGYRDHPRVRHVSQRLELG
jgi:uncharacterized protein (TIGR02996 family)